MDSRNAQNVCFKATYKYTPPNAVSSLRRPIVPINKPYIVHANVFYLICCLMVYLNSESFVFALCKIRHNMSIYISLSKLGPIKNRSFFRFFVVCVCVYQMVQLCSLHLAQDLSLAKDTGP